MKILADYIDKNGMVCTLPNPPQDGGDSCAHGCAILYAALRDEDMAAEAMLGGYSPKLEVNSGEYCRNPDPNMWYSRVNTFSRDQLTPLLALLGFRQQYAALRRLFRAHLKRLLLFAWNTREINSYPDGHTGVSYAWKIPDLTGPDIWGMYIRGFDLWPLYPILLLSDAFTLGGSIIYRLKLSSSTIHMNQIIMVDFSNLIMPTPLSWLAQKIYGKSTPIAALQASWGPSWQPPVDEFLTNLINEHW